MKRNVLSAASKRSFFFFGIGLMLLCAAALSAEAKPNITKESFGKTVAGKTVDLYTLTNSKGTQIRITNYGGIVVSIKVADNKGVFADVVLGYDTLAGYEKDDAYFGAIIGRFANRIAKGRFTLGGKNYQLAVNNGENHLHGGVKAFHKAIWKVVNSSADAAGARLELTYTSRDGEESYPGKLNVRTVYTLTENDELRIDYQAQSDQDTIINLTNHSYFNLASAGAGSILNHEMQINADRFTPTDATSIPTGELRSVRETPFDFTAPAIIGARIEAADEQIKFGSGYDQNWVINKSGDALALAARAYEPTSGRVLEVFTTEPGVQFYSGNFLNGMTGKNGKIYRRREGFCLETQHFPDSPNKPNFPTTVLKANRIFASTTVYKFSSR